MYMCGSTCIDILIAIDIREIETLLFSYTCFSFHKILINKISCLISNKFLLCMPSSTAICEIPVELTKPSVMLSLPVIAFVIYM